MKKRLLTSAVGIPFAFLVLYLYNTLFYDCVLAAICVVGFHEAFQAYGQKYSDRLFAAISVCAAVTFSAVSGGWCSPGSLWALNGAVWFLFLIVFIAFVLRHFSEVDVAKLCGSLFLCALLYGFFYSVLQFKLMFPFREYGYLGAFLLLLILAYAWGGDSAAQLGGMAFGHKKLCPVISPNKTVAGAVAAPFGSVLLSMLFLGLFRLLMPVLQPAGAMQTLPGWAWWVVLAGAVPACFIGMIGDLIASCVKRQVGIKDYGSLFPGMGGVIDKFDSATTVAMFVACCCGIYMAFLR